MPGLEKCLGVTCLRINPFLRSWRQDYPQITRNSFTWLPNEIRINTLITFIGEKFTQLKNFCRLAKIKIQKILSGWIHQLARMQVKGFLKNSLFYFGVVFFVLFGALFFYSNTLAEPNYLKDNNIAFFNSFFKNNAENLTNDDLFFSQNSELALQTPDLKISDNAISAVSTPSVLTTQTLGDIFGGSSQTQKDVVNYTVLPGDTIQSIADNFKISKNTVLWANNLSSGADAKAGQNLVILPVSGVLHIVKNGDTLNQIAKTYKASVDDIVAFNGLASEQDIFIGDTLIIPNGLMPQKAASPYAQLALPNSSLIYPLLNFRITQGLHYFNAIDIQPIAGCGTPIYASAAGVVQRVLVNGGWNFGGGDSIVIYHSGLDVSTYYGHIEKSFVKSGDIVYQGQEIALVGGQPGMFGAGDSTGCHVHWQVMGAKNPLAGLSVGTVINVNK